MSDSYFVKYKGRIQGPFTLAQLKSGLKSNKLSRSHHVSVDRKEWVPLGEVPGIMPQAPVSPPEIKTPTPAASAQAAAGETSSENSLPPPPADPDDSTLQYDPRWAIKQSHGLLRGLLTASGICMLLFVLLPIMVVELPDGNEVIWHWTMWSKYEGPIQFLLIFLTLGGAGLITVANTTQGLARSITSLAILFLSMLFLQKVMQTSDFTAAGDLMMLLMFLIPLGLVLATTQWRQLGPTLPRRVLTCVICSLFTLSSAIWFIDYLFELDFDGLGSGFIATIMITLVILNFALFGLGITAGVLGIRLVSPTSPPKSIKRCNLLAKIVFLLTFAGAFVSLAVGFVDGTSNTEMLTILFQMTRGIGLGLFAFVIIGYCGCYELMITFSAMSLERPVKQVTKPVLLQQPPSQKE